MASEEDSYNTITLKGTPVTELKVTDIKKELDKRGLSKSGSKTQLLERLKAQLLLEKLQQDAAQSSGDELEGKVPNMALQQDNKAGQSEFVRQYLEQQQKNLEIQMEVKKQVEEERKRKSADESSADESNATETNVPAGSRSSNDPDVTSPKKFKDEASNAPAKSKEVSKMPRPARKSSRNASKSENGQEGELVKEHSRSPTPESERLRERTRSGSSSSSRSPTPEKTSRSRRGRQARGRATKRGGGRRKGQYATKESRSSSSSSQEEVTPKKRQHRRTNSISSRSRSKSPPAVSPEVTVTSRRSSRRVNVARKTPDEEVPDDGGGVKVKKGEINKNLKDSPKLSDDGEGVKAEEINKNFADNPKLLDDAGGVKSEEINKNFQDNLKLPDDGGVKSEETNKSCEDNPELPDDGGVTIKSGESLEDNPPKKSETHSHINIDSTEIVQDEIPVNQALVDKQSPCKTSPIQKADANQGNIEMVQTTENKGSIEFIKDSNSESAIDVKVVSTKEIDEVKLQPDAYTKSTPESHEKELNSSEKTVAVKVEEKSTSRLSRWKSSKSKATPAEKSDALLSSEQAPDVPSKSDSNIEDSFNVSERENTTLINVDISSQPVESSDNKVREQTKNDSNSESNLDSTAKLSESPSQSKNDEVVEDKLKETHKNVPLLKSKRKDSRSSDTSSSGSSSRSKSPKNKRSRSQSSSASSSSRSRSRSRSRSSSSGSNTDRSLEDKKGVTSHVKNKESISQESLHPGSNSEQLKDKYSFVGDVSKNTVDEDEDPKTFQSSIQRSSPRLRVSPHKNQDEREKEPDVLELKKGIDLETPRGDADTGKEMDIDNGSKESQQNEQDPDAKLKKEKSAKKRKWGSQTSKATKTTKKSTSLEISSDSLKNLIGDVKLTETVFDMEMEVVNTLDYDEHEEDRRDVKVKRMVVQSPQPDQIKEEIAPQEDDRKVETRDEDQHEEPLSPAEPEKKIIKLSAAAPKEGGKKKSKEGKKGKKRKEEMAAEKESEDAKSTDKENKVYATTRSSKPLLPIVDEPEPVTGKQSPARNPTDRVIRIAGLVRPFTVGQLKELLRRSGELDDDYFWINDIKSHCLAAYKTEEDAIKARAALHGTRWPQSNPKILIVDFATVNDVNHRKAEGDVPLPALVKKSQEDFKKIREQKEEEEKDKRQKLREQRDKEREEKEKDVREKRDEKDRTRRREPEKKNPVREWDRDKVQQLSKSRSRSKERERPVRRSRSRSREREQLKRRDQSRDKKEEERRKEKKQKETKSEEEPPAKLLDDLFRKTKAVPCIYWLPLTEEQSVQRAAKKLEMEKERQKRIAAAEEREKEEQKKREAARLERQRERERGRERSREREREKTRQERSRSSRSDSRSRSRRRR